MYLQPPAQPQPSRAPLPAFGRGADPLKLYNEVIRTFKGPYRLSGELLKGKEGAAGNAHTKFLQDTAILWLPKSLISRSWIEFGETTFLEFIESAFFYYMAPLASALALNKIFQAVTPKKWKPDPKYVTKSLKEIPANELAKVIPVKAATVIAGILITSISGEYALNFVKNLITDKAFKRHKFDEIVNLTKNQAKTKSDTTVDTPVAKKAKRRIAECLAIGAAIFVGTLAIARFGPRSTDGVLHKLVKKFDFGYVEKANGKVSFDLVQNHLKVAMPIAVVGYWDSARDRLEMIEAGCRSTITGWYIGWGSEWLKEEYHKRYQKVPGYKEIFGKDGVKKWAEIQDDVVKKVGATSMDTLSAAQKKNAKALMLERFLAKQKMEWIPYAFGILVIGLFTAAMNQLWTKIRYNAQQKKAKAARVEYRAHRDLAAPASRVVQPAGHVTLYATPLQPTQFAQRPLAAMNAPMMRPFAVRRQQPLPGNSDYAKA